MSSSASSKRYRFRRTQGLKPVELLFCPKQRTEDLLLLSPEERCSIPTSGRWNNTDESNWGKSLSAGSFGDLATAAENVDDLIADQHHAPFDMAGILASLAGQELLAGEQLLTCEESPSPPIEAVSSNTVSNYAHCASSGTADELETIDDPEMAAAFADDAHHCLAEMEASLPAIEAGR